MLRTDGVADPLVDCVTVVGTLTQMAVLREISPELHELTRAFNVHLIACIKVNDSKHRAVLEMATRATPQLCGSANGQPPWDGMASDRSSWSAFSACRGCASATQPAACTWCAPTRDLHALSRNCLDACSPMEFELLKIIIIGCKNDGVVIGGVVPYGGVASRVFGALAPLLTQLGREALDNDQTFECMMPARGEGLPHGKYFYEKFVAFATKAAAAYERCALPTAQRLGLECSAASGQFAEVFYSRLRERRLQQDPELPIPLWGEARREPRMDMGKHSRDEFLVCGQVLYAAGLPCDAEAILRAIELGASLGLADMAMELPGGRLLVVEYDGAHWHGPDRLEEDKAKTARLLTLE